MYYMDQKLTSHALDELAGSWLT